MLIRNVIICSPRTRDTKEMMMIMGGKITKPIGTNRFILLARYLECDFRKLLLKVLIIFGGTCTGGWKEQRWLGDCPQKTFKAPEGLSPLPWESSVDKPCFVFLSLPLANYFLL